MNKVSKEQFDAAIDELFPIQVGETYVFTKSGNEVRVVEATSVVLNGKTVEGHTVARIDSGKTLFAPKGTLKTKAELGLDKE